MQRSFFRSYNEDLPVPALWEPGNRGAARGGVPPPKRADLFGALRARSLGHGPARHGPPVMDVQRLL